jgi:two-component system, NtrC family, response regulator AtoC
MHAFPPRQDVGATPQRDVGVTAAAPAAAHDEPEYLLCIDREQSWRVPLPRDGELVIGRGPEAHLRLGDGLVSRAHACITVLPDGLRLSDLDSRHGTLVNGVRVAGSRLLVSGDVVALGGTLLVVHRPTRASARGLLDPGALARRLEEEVERALRYQRELSLVVLRFAAPFDRARVINALAPQLRLMDAAAVLGDSEVALLLPEIGETEAEPRVTGLLAALGAIHGGVAAGMASSPGDGCDPDTLLSGVRTAAAEAAAGGVTRVRDAVRTLALGDRHAIVADPAMLRLYELIKRLARADLPILVQGETGAGKELAAAAVHAFSARAGGPFVSLNCAAVPAHLAESELFGHERGAFTGAVATKPGTIELAAGGTLFLDEIGELPLPLQAMLLRFLETRRLTRVGDVREREVDVRVVAATNRDLEVECAAGRFRRDLFFRLGAARIVLPPLRDRPRELPLLARRLLDQACARLARPTLSLSVAALQALYLHRWPGNVRELRNAMDYAAASVPEGAAAIEPWHLPEPLPSLARGIGAEPVRAAPARPGHGHGLTPTPPPVARGAFRPIAAEVEELERRRMVEALGATGGVQNKAAELIDMPLRTFVTKLRRYAISPADWK